MRALILFTLLFSGPLTMAQENMGDVETEQVEPVAQPLQTGLFFNPNFTISSRKLDLQDAQVGKARNAQFDSKIGYIFDFGLFAGVQGNFSVGSASFGTNIDTDTTTYFMGPTVGYSCSWTGLFLSATYHIFGSSDWDTLGKYDKVEGLQIDIGYPMMLSEKVKVGPQISIKNLDLKEGSTGLADNKIKELTPYFGLWLYF